MADVFISYAKPERQLAADLAHYLEGEGYTVWWDTELTSGETFRNNIETELDAAKAVAVLWTTTSVTRDWVIAEAEHAARRGILIPLRSADLDLNLIPKPYSTRHTELIENRPAIIAALKRLNVVPRYAHTAGGSLHDQFWKAIEGSQSVADYEFYLKEFPEGPHAPFARLRIHQLQQAVEGQRKTKPASTGGTSIKSVAAPLLGGLFFSAVILGSAWYYTAPVFSQLNAKIDRLVGEVLLARKADDADWEKAEAEGLIKSWQAYLAKRPIGVYEAEARKRIQERRKDRVFAVLGGHEAAIAKIDTDVSGFNLTSYDEVGWQFLWDATKKVLINRTKLPRSAQPKEERQVVESLACSNSYTIGNFHITTDSCGMTWVDISWNSITRRIEAHSGNKLEIFGLDRPVAIVNKRVFDLRAEITGQKGVDLPIGGTFACIEALGEVFAFCTGREVLIQRKEGGPAHSLNGHKGNIRSLSATKEGAVLISGDDIGEIRLWDISDL